MKGDRQFRIELPAIDCSFSLEKMPQLPTNTAEEYGADDEVKEYRQEDDEGSENSTVDVVNDIKSDLIKKDAEDQTLDSVST